MQWFSVSNQHYRIRRSSNLTNGFGPLRTNILATPPMNVHTDVTAFGSEPLFYQVELTRVICGHSLFLEKHSGIMPRL